MKKILIVDDNRDVRQLLSRYVAMMGFATATAENGKEALHRAISEKPDLILMDIMMPEMDGREATRLLRAMPDTHDIPIIAVTAIFYGSELQRCLDAGCNDYIVKPFSYPALEAKIGPYMNR